MSGGRFDVCVQKTLGHEGVFSNHAADKGGATKYGITQATLHTAIAARLVPRGITIQRLSVEQAKRIYFAFYWTAARCNEFPSPLDLLLFDAYVNHRPKSAVRLIQTALGVEADGILGPITIAKARELVAEDGDGMWAAIERYAEARRQLYTRIVAEDPTQAVFLKGWIARAERVAAQAATELLPVPA